MWDQFYNQTRPQINHPQMVQGTPSSKSQFEGEQYQCSKMNENNKPYLQEGDKISILWMMGIDMMGNL